MPNKRRQISYIVAQYRVEKRRTFAILSGAVLAFCWVASSGAQQAPAPASPDAVVAAQRPSTVQPARPEQKKTAHDLSDIFNAGNAKPSSDVTNGQPKQGKIYGFDFYRDPLN